MNPGYTRIPFELAEVERVLNFCAAHPIKGFTQSLRRSFLTSLTSGSDGVIELHDKDGCALIAVVTDAVNSVADCAVLVLIGLREATSLPGLLEVVLDEAMPFVRAGARQGIEVPVEPRCGAWVPILQARGFQVAFTTFDMETSHQPPPPLPRMPGPKWAWISASSEWIGDHYEAVRLAMIPVPGAYIGSLERFQKNIEDPDKTNTLLIADSRVAGFTCVGMASKDVGSVHLIGRHPDFRGQGLGKLLLAYAMNQLATLGAQRFSLDVTASNQAALWLYQKAGFETKWTVPVYRKQAH